MNLPTLLKKPLIAGVIGAATIAVPVSALYVAGATRAVATTPAPAAATTAPDHRGARGDAAGLQLHGAEVRPGGRQHRRHHQGVGVVPGRR